MSEGDDEQDASMNKDRPWWWFSLSREGGGPTYYGESVGCPSFVRNLDVGLCVCAFSLPVVTFFILLPSFRHKHWISFFVMMLCLITGLLVICTYNASSWLVGTVHVHMNNGPRQPPSLGALGLWAGFSHVNLTYESANLSLNEQVNWSDRQSMVSARRKALEKGWVWPLVSLVTELSGEGLAWRGKLGDGMRYAGTCGSVFMRASMYVWSVSLVLISIAPELSARPLMLMGVLLASTSFSYVLILWMHIPKTIIIGGKLMELHLGWAWWIVCILGIILTVVGSVMLIYDFKYPKQLSTFFELHSGTPYHRLFQEKLDKEMEVGPSDEDYRKVYPPCYWNMGFSVDDEEDGVSAISDIKSVEECSNSTKTYVKRVSFTADTGVLMFYKDTEKNTIYTEIESLKPQGFHSTPQHLRLPASLRHRITPEPDRLGIRRKSSDSVQFFGSASPKLPVRKSNEKNLKSSPSIIISDSDVQQEVSTPF